MSVLRLSAPIENAPLVELSGVSRVFSMHSQRTRSMQELFISFLGRRKSDQDVFWPLRDISLTISAGDCMGVIGPNGSGKSTLLKLVTGILEPTSGEMVVSGRLSSLLELGAGFQGDLTGRENIYLNGSIYGLSRSAINQRIDRIIDYAELGEFIDTPVKHYSSGMYVRLGFAVAIHTEPDLLLVDEVLAVGDLSFQKKCLASIYRFRNSGGTIFLVSHDLATIQSICNRVLWLEDGLVQADGDATDVIMQYQRHVAAKEEAKLAVASRAGTHLHDGAGRRWGTRELEIVNVELFGANGEPKSVFFTGETMRIRIQYCAHTPIDHPVIGLSINHQNGVNIFGPNTKLAGLDIAYADGDGAIDYVLPELPLLEGGYAISVAAVDYGDTVTYDYHDRAYPFQVFPGNRTFGYGMVTLQGQWEVGQQSADEVEDVELVHEG